MVQTSISSEDESLYARLLEAAKIRNDQNLLIRLSGVPNGDLVAVEARYHRTKTCMLRMYLKDVSSKGRSQEDSAKQAFKRALNKLGEEHLDRIVNNNEVFLLSKLTEQYRHNLKCEDVSNADAYRSNKLKTAIMSSWENVHCISVPGESDLVCSSSITVGEALKKARRQKPSRKNMK